MDRFLKTNDTYCSGEFWCDVVDEAVVSGILRRPEPEAGREDSDAQDPVRGCVSQKGRSDGRNPEAESVEEAASVLLLEAATADDVVGKKAEDESVDDGHKVGYSAQNSVL